MRFYLKLFIFGFVLFVGGNFTFAQNLTVEQFNTLWDNSTSCDDTVRGCIKNPKQRTGDFQTVEIKKLVGATSTPGIFQINILLRGKQVSQTNKKICSVVVFDQSESMGIITNTRCERDGSGHCIKGTKWNNAESGAIIYSETLINQNINSKIGLIFFSTTAKTGRNLDHSTLGNEFVSEYPIFNSSTNIDDGLVKAGNMLSGADCESKYIILMSDGHATSYGTAGTYNDPNSTNGYVSAQYAIEKAEILKNNGVIIYSIGYEVTSGAKLTLQNIASNENHYFDATISNVQEIFQNIGTIQNIKNAGEIITLEDEVGGAFSKISNIEIASGTEITESGTVYSFQIKPTNPNITGFHKTNSGLTLTYVDATGIELMERYQTLSITNSAEIYWTPLKCEGIYPNGTNVLTGSDTFEQYWSGDTLKPENKEWKYTDNSNPGECEWTCSDKENYSGNTTTNTCDSIVTASFDLNGGTGTILPIRIISGTNIEEPSIQPDRPGYHFIGWMLNGEIFTFPGILTGSVTLTAGREPNTYEIKFYGNESTSGNMENQQFTYDLTGTLNPNKYEREGYSFSGWNTKPDGTHTRYSDKATIKNLAKGGVFELFAQRKPNGNSGGSNSGGGGSSGGGGHKKDNCPDGDYSGDYYDGKCGKKPNQEPDKEKPTTGTESAQTKPTTESEQTKPASSTGIVVTNNKCSIEGSTHSTEVNKAYIWACENGIIKSDKIQDAKLGEFLDRAEMAKMITIFEMSELNAKPNKNKDCSAFENSIAGYNQEMKNYMITSCQLERMGIHTADYTPISNFNPKKLVSRAEFGTILSRILRGNKYEAEKNSRYYYVNHLNKLKDSGILTNLDPKLTERRSYAILMMYRTAKMMGKVE